MPNRKFSHIEFNYPGNNPITFSSIKVFREILELIQKDFDLLVEKGYAGKRTRYILYINHDFYNKMETLMLDTNISVMEDLKYYFQRILWMDAEIKSVETEVMGILIIRITPYLHFVGKCFDEDKLFNKMPDPKFVIPGGKKDV